MSLTLVLLLRAMMMMVMMKESKDGDAQRTQCLSLDQDLETTELSV